MPQGLSGLTDATFQNLILDAGAVYFNIDIDELEEATADDFEDAVAEAIADAVPVGATRGGARFNRGLTLREIEADGKLGPTKGLNRRTEVRPVIEVTLLEQTIENIQRQFPGAVVETAGLWEKITGGPIVDDTYIDNVALITTFGEEGRLIVMVVFNALVMESPDFQTEDKNEVATTVAFMGNFAGANAGEPWAIYHPGEIEEEGEG